MSRVVGAMAELIKAVAEAAGCEVGEVERVDVHAKEFKAWVVIRKQVEAEAVIIDFKTGVDLT